MHPAGETESRSRYFCRNPSRMEVNLKDFLTVTFTLFAVIDIIGTVPGAFRHARHGYVGLHVMYRSLVDG